MYFDEILEHFLEQKKKLLIDESLIIKDFSHLDGYYLMVRYWDGYDKPTYSHTNYEPLSFDEALCLYRMANVSDHTVDMSLYEALKNGVKPKISVKG